VTLWKNRTNLFVGGSILKYFDGVSDYNDLPYGSGYSAALDPQRLLAHPDLRRWAWPPTTRGISRVLDIACGSGKQIIVSALQNPNTEFFGVDGSQAHINESSLMIGRLGLKNISVECADLREWKPIEKGFDLICCSGTYPWVPDDVRARILDAITRGLRDDGLALLHIITKPGCVGLEEAQRRVLAQSAREPTLAARLAAARAYVRTLPPLAKGEAAQSFESIVRRTLEQFVERDDPGLAHEFLGSQVRPFFFAEFVAVAREYGLHVVSDASFAATSDAYIEPGHARALYERTSDWVKQQELIDMFGGMGGGRTVILRKSPRPSETVAVRFDACHLFAFSRYGAKIEEGIVKASDKHAIAITALEQALLERLTASFPASVARDSLTDLSSDSAAIDAAIERWWELGYVGGSAMPIAFHSFDADRPNTWPIARAEIDLGQRALTSRLAWSLTPHPFMVFALAQCDGTRTRSEVEASLKDWLKRHSQGAARRRTEVEMIDASAAPLKDGWRTWWQHYDKDGKRIEPPKIEAAVAQILPRLNELGFFE
jgi:SAM-dependent methyltransferase